MIKTNYAISPHTLEKVREALGVERISPGNKYKQFHHYFFRKGIISESDVNIIKKLKPIRFQLPEENHQELSKTIKNIQNILWLSPI